MRRQGVALDDIAHVAIRRSDPVATGVLIGGTVAAMTGAGLIIGYSIIGSGD